MRIERNVLLLVDGAQSVGALEFDVRTTPVDAMTVGASKYLCGPYGFGFLYVRRERAEAMQPGSLARYGIDLDAALITNIDPPSDVDEALASNAPIEASLEKWYQGPFADALTHVGQLAMLRRMFGAPMKGEAYVRADIEPGRVGPDQAAADAANAAASLSQVP